MPHYRDFSFMLKIPFGKHKISGRFLDAASVSNGLKCDCLCIECGTALEAVHPRLSRRQKYFRHSAKLNCKGGLESLFHLVAKQILRENNLLRISESETFHYTSCDIETSRHDKQPDAFLQNETGSLIVEIFFSHRIAGKTLDCYLNKGEMVLEIDISGERRNLFDYNRLKKLILEEAPRNLYSEQMKYPIVSADDDRQWWLLLLLAAGGLLFLWRSKQHHDRKRSRIRKKVARR